MSLAPSDSTALGDRAAGAIDRPLEVECPACGAHGLRGFYRHGGAPSHSCLLLDSAAQAERFPRGDIELAFCRRCGFITNAAVDPSLQAYSARYEETQGFSPRFRSFAHSLAQRLVARHDLHGQQVLEIGCGKGEFLVDLCELGAGRGVGIDPAIVEERLDSPAAARIEWIRDYWSERYAHLGGDLVVCRHTLEHIARPGEFLRLLRRTLDHRPGAVVFFEVPDVRRVLDERAFWDLYYEHCSYYTAGSLARQFRTAGFDVAELALDFDGQYILIEATPAFGPGGAAHGSPAGGRSAPPLGPIAAREEELPEVDAAVKAFAASIDGHLKAWRERLGGLSRDGKRIVLWGSGSKAVSYLTTLGIEREVEFVVDINPYKHGKYIAGTGQRIVEPEFLASLRPDVVIAMNPVYREEIGRDLARVGVQAELLTA